MLKDQTFTDLYLGEKGSWLSGVPNTFDPTPAPDSCLQDLQQIRARCEEIVEKTGKDEFSVSHVDILFRASKLRSLSETVFVLRRIPALVPELSTLGFHSGHVARMLTPRLTGLLIIAGAFGQGKTTTASSIIVARLKQFGGIAVCIEDPPEMPLEGRHGEGVCYQRWVDRGGFGFECRQVARWAPSIIFVGEVRDAETATEALKAGTNGRLVICTIHADGVKTAVERMFALANGHAGDSEDVASLLASGLTGVLHQRLEGDAPRRPVAEMLWLASSPEAAGAQNMIRQRKWNQLDNEIMMQRNAMMMRRS